MENAVNASTAGSGGQIVVAGAGYAGLHVTLRLTAKLRDHPEVELILVDRNDYHQAITELPRVASGTRAADAVRIPLQQVLATRVRFVQTEINGFDLAGRRLLTGAGPIDWRRLVLALGSRPNDFAIPGLAQRLSRVQPDVEIDAGGLPRVEDSVDFVYNGGVASVADSVRVGTQITLKSRPAVPRRKPSRQGTSPPDRAIPSPFRPR